MENAKPTAQGIRHSVLCLEFLRTTSFSMGSMWGYLEWKLVMKRPCIWAYCRAQYWRSYWGYR